MEKSKDKQLAKKEVLIKTSKIMNPDAFEGLRSLYINILPYSIQVGTPIQLFHYLDSVGYLSLKELAHNLRSMGYRESLKDLEEYIHIYETKESTTTKHPGEIVKILRNGLRNSDIRELKFIFNNSYEDKMDELLIDICSYGLGMYLDVKHILNLLTSYGSPSITAGIKKDLEKVGLFESHECREREERIFVLNISRDLDNDESLQSLMFMYKIPISIWESIKNGLDLFEYLYCEGTLNLQKLSDYGKLTNFPTLATNIENYIKNIQGKSNSDLCCCKQMKKFKYTLTKAKEALQNESNPNIFFDFMAHLLGHLEVDTLDFSKLAMLLIVLERFDIVKSLTRMGFGQVSKHVPEGAAFSTEEFRLFQLRFKLDSIMIRKLAELYKIKRTFYFTGEFLSYLCIYGLSDIEVMKENLKKIGSPELRVLLDCYE